MHRVWDILELVAMIAELLPNADLSRLARTCSKLFTPISTSLWKSICDAQLSALSRCIKADPTAVQLLHGDPPRWKIYTHAVQDIAVGSEKVDYLDLIDLCSMALVTTPGENSRVLPNLTSIRLSCWELKPSDKRYAMSACMLLLSPSLKTIYVGLGHALSIVEADRIHVNHLFSMLAASSSCLVDVAIHGVSIEYCTGPLLDALQNLVSRSKSLKSFTGGEWITNTRLFDALGRLPVLEKLIISQDRFGYDELVTEHFDLVNVPKLGSSALQQFRPLRHLAISINLTDCAALLNSLSALTEIHLTTWQDSLSLSLGKIMGTRFSSSLEKVNWYHEGTLDPATVRMFRDNLFGLLPCRKLTSLLCELESREDSVFLDDADVFVIVQSWPVLRVLELLSVKTSSSFKSLAMFAKHCPLLEVLTIGISALTSIPIPPTISLLKRQLELRIVCDSTEELASLDAAIFIYSLWPNVRLYDPNDPECLGEVQKHIQGFQALAKIEDALATAQELSPGMTIGGLLRR